MNKILTVKDLNDWIATCHISDDKKVYIQHPSFEEVDLACVELAINLDGNLVLVPFNGEDET